jgi:hypothetical protein
MCDMKNLAKFKTLGELAPDFAPAARMARTHLAEQ